MSIAYQIVVCGSIVPDPLQTLEPVASPTGPALKNEMMLPAVCGRGSLLQRNGRHALEGAVGRVHRNANGFQSGHSQNRLHVVRPKNDPKGVSSWY
jgi:hypothetical protein